MPQVFDGIAEKLKRTNENIRNLESEIAAFFDAGEYPILPEDDKELLLKAIEYHKNRVVPLRFSVLTGEIVHHLRSILDHIVWHFSTDEDYRRDYFWKIEFPIFEDEPLDKKSVSKYEGKIKGITDSKVIALIKKLQPYSAPDPIDDPLLIIQKMDIIDKHRELVLCAATGSRNIPMNTPIGKILWANRNKMSSDVAAEIGLKLKGYGHLTPNIAFRNFGGREVEAVIPGMTQLNNHIVQTIKAFAEL